jgi:hypothetical protein
MSNSRFSILQAKAISDKRITNSQFRTLAALGAFGDENGWCFPKLRTLAEMLGKTKQAVSKDLTALCSLEYIEIKAQYRKDGSRQHNLYRLKFDLESPPRQPDVDTPQPGVNAPSTSEVDGVSTSEVDALTSHINAPLKLKDSVPVSEILTCWRSCFPKKPQPRENSKAVTQKLSARWKSPDFRENWRAALEAAAASAACQQESWFSFEFFVRNDENYQKMLDRWMSWKDAQYSPAGFQRGGRPTQPDRNHPVPKGV